jgi:chloramphenicol-sensitive protein RarD
MNLGLVFAIGCYGLWGVLPVYWKSIEGVPAGQILCHRMIWSLVFLLVILAIKRDWSWLRPLMKQPTTLLVFVTLAMFISGNWFVYIWAVNNGYIVETSLGYFMNPLVNVLLGVTFLGERPRKLQVLAIATAFVGVAYLTFVYGQLPWIALVLAFSFGLYGLIKKIVKLGPLRGLTLETALLFFPALAYLISQENMGVGAFTNVSLITDLLLSGVGVITAIPLLLFASAAQHLSLTTLGILQYLAPTLQFLIGVFVYKEAFSEDKLLGFAFVWVALMIFAVEGLYHSRDKTNLYALARLSRDLKNNSPLS